LAAPPADLATICASGEAAARRHVLSKVDRSLIRSLDIVVSAEKGKRKEKNFSVDVSIELDPVVDIDVEALADEAAEAALSEIDLNMKGQKA